MEPKEFMGELDKKLADHTKAFEKEATEVKKANEALEAKVADLNADVIKKGGTIENLLNDVQELKAKEGRMSQMQRAHCLLEKVKEIVNENLEAISGAKFSTGAQFKFWGPNYQKVVGAIASANLTGDTYQSYIDWRPGMEPTGQIRFRDVFPRIIPSATDYVQFPRAATPIGEGSFANQTEGSAKPQVDRDYAMIDVTLGTMAGFATVSRQSLRNIIFLQEWLPTSLLEQLLDTEDLDFANALVAAATGSTSTTGFTGTPNVADKLMIYIKNLIKGKYAPNVVAAAPEVWLNLIALRPGTAGESYSGPIPVTVTMDGVVRILNKPVFPVNWLTGNRVIVGDSSKVAIVQSEGLQLRQSDSHASTFVANQITYLLERTQGLATFRPDAFVTTTIS